MGIGKPPACSLKLILLAAVLLLLGCESEQQARERAEKEHWETARQDHTTQAYAAFLTTFPDGRHAAEAADTLAELSWEETMATNTQAWYRDFVDKFPSSSYVEEAKRRS